MRSIVLNPNGGMRTEETEKPTPRPGQALIRVLVCGVCSSDMGVYRTGLGQDEILGHEVVGMVESVGDDADSAWIGKRVTGAIMHGYAEYTIADCEALIQMPEGLRDHEGITEPLSCMISGIRRSGCANAGEVLIVGAGFMGLALISLLKAAHVSQVFVTDTKPGAVRNAIRFGADWAGRPEEMSRSFEYVFEMGGVQGSLDQAAKLTAQYGTLTIVGYHAGMRQADMGLWASKAFTVINAFEYHREIQLDNMRYALELVKQGILPIDQLFTHRFPLERTDEAFRTHLNRPDGFIKSYIFNE